jgi:hypothetical protein
MKPPPGDPRGRRASAILHLIGTSARRFEFAAGTIGFLFGLVVMTWGSLPRPGSGHPGDAFLRSPEAQVWLFLVAAQFAFWFSALPFQWHERCVIKDEFRLRFTGEIRGKHLLALLMFLAPAVLIARSLPVTPLAHHRAKVMLVNLVAVLAAVVAVEGIWYVGAALGGAGWSEGTAPDGATRDRARVKSYLSLREGLQRFITFLGAMISLGTLAKGASRHAYIAARGSPVDFPPEYVLLHGAYFTGLLALVYIPTYTRLVAVGGDILDSVFPLTAPDVELRRLAEWQSNRKSLEELLQLRSGALDNLRASVAILAPLASGTASVLLGDKLLLGTQ